MGDICGAALCNNTHCIAVYLFPTFIIPDVYKVEFGWVIGGGQRERDWRVFHLNSTHTPIMQFDIVFSCYIIYLYLTEKCHSDLGTSRDWNHKQPSFRSIDNNLNIVNCDRRTKLPGFSFPFKARPNIFLFTLHLHRTL